MKSNLRNKLRDLIAKVDLKALAFVERLSEITLDDYLLRLVLKGNQVKYANGDWTEVTGLNDVEDEPVSKFIPDLERFNDNISRASSGGETSFTSELKTSDGKVSVRWKSKYVPECSSIILIGRVKR